jgi:hypothetical protein
MVVDGKPYRVWLTATYRREFYQLRLLVRANFGAMSSAAIEGLRNFSRWEHYGYWWSEDFNATTKTIAVTPRLIAVLIRHALGAGWNPDQIKSQFQLEISNVEAKALLAAFNSQLANV